MTIELKTGLNDTGRRLDRILRKSLPNYSLSLIHRLLRQGKIRVNGVSAHPDDRILAISLIHIEVKIEPLVNHKKSAVNKNIVNCRSERVSKNNIPVNYRPGRVNHSSATLPEILWRGSGIIIFNKPPGLASHGKDSLDMLVKNWLADKIPPSLSFKPGPLHRLDQPSSGIMAFSENLEGARWFSRLLRERKLTKTYLAIVEGEITGDELWQDELVRDKSIKKTFTKHETDKPQNALTAIRPLASHDSYTLIEARIITGRTHQIRAHAALHGHPLAGDKKYGALPFSGGLCLHAWKIEPEEKIEGFPHPLIAPLPKEFLSRIKILFASANNLGKEIFS